MSNDTVIVLNTLTEEVGSIRRKLFDSPVFNPDGLLVEIEDPRSGCVDCGTAAENAEIVPVAADADSSEEGDDEDKED